MKLAFNKKQTTEQNQHEHGILTMFFFRKEMKQTNFRFFFLGVVENKSGRKVFVVVVVVEKGMTSLKRTVFGT